MYNRVLDADWYFAGTQPKPVHTTLALKNKWKTIKK